MSKIVLPPITGAQNLTTLNSNFQKIADALNEKVFYRDNPEGEPNQLADELDMNGQRIYNLPEPVQDNEPLRKADVSLIVTELNQEVLQAIDDATQAAIDAEAAAVGAGSAAVAANAAAVVATATATNAVTTANAANTTAGNALTAANSAVTTAGTANTNASAAVTTANTASTNASNAVTTANAANTLAGTANTNASAAVTTAGNAVTTANAASAAVATKANAGANTDITSLGNLGSLNGGVLRGRQNYLLNGSFDVWQLGSNLTVTTNLQKLSDRWNYSFNGTVGTLTATKIGVGVAALGTAAYSPPWSMLLNQAVAGTGNTLQELTSPIENVRTLQGRKVTLSFYVFSAVTKPIIPRIRQNFGTGGSPSAAVTVTGTTINLVANAWTRYTSTFDIPSITSKVLGSNGDDSLNVILGLPLNQTFTIYITGVQLEEGPVATAYEERPYAQIFADCQRYLQSSYQDGVPPGSVTSEGVVATNRTAGASLYTIPLNPMRTVAMTYYNPATGAAGTWNAAGTAIAVSTNTFGTKNVTVAIPAGTATFVTGHYVAQDISY